MIKIQINFENRKGESETYSFPPLKENRLPPLPLPSTGFNVPAINHRTPTTASTTDLYRKHAVDSRLLTLFDFRLVRGCSIRHFVDKNLGRLSSSFHFHVHHSSVSRRFVRSQTHCAQTNEFLQTRSSFPRLLLFCFFRVWRLSPRFTDRT